MPKLQYRYADLLELYNFSSVLHYGWSNDSLIKKSQRWTSFEKFTLLKAAKDWVEKYND